MITSDEVYKSMKGWNVRHAEDFLDNKELYFPFGAKYFLGWIAATQSTEFYDQVLKIYVDTQTKSMKLHGNERRIHCMIQDLGDHEDGSPYRDEEYYDNDLLYVHLSELIAKNQAHAKKIMSLADDEDSVLNVEVGLDNNVLSSKTRKGYADPIMCKDCKHDCVHLRLEDIKMNDDYVSGKCSWCREEKKVKVKKKLTLTLELE